jgi:hypothetical protein
MYIFYLVSHIMTLSMSLIVQHSMTGWLLIEYSTENGVKRVEQTKFEVQNRDFTR